MSDAYARAGVDTGAADRGVAALVEVLRRVDTGRPSRTALAPGHYASVVELAPGLGVALATDGVGSKLVVAQQAGRFDTVGIDCVAMNVNDVVCVGAEPLALVDYLAVEAPDEELLAAIGEGLRAGAQDAGVEVVGGELAVLPELIRGHPSPRGFDLTATCIGGVALDAIVDGRACRPGDVVIGLPSSGVHSNGLKLARRVLLDDAGLALDERPAGLAGATVADILLEPTIIYVRALLELLRSEVPVHGLAHITGGGVTNLLRLAAPVGFELDTPLPVPPSLALIAELGALPARELYEVFNMGCGMCCVVPAEGLDDALERLGRRHPGAARIGTVTADEGRVTLPGLALAGDRDGLAAA